MYHQQYLGLGFASRQPRTVVVLLLLSPLPHCFFSQLFWRYLWNSRPGHCTLGDTVVSLYDQLSAHDKNLRTAAENELVLSDTIVFGSQNLANSRLSILMVPLAVALLHFITYNHFEKQYITIRCPWCYCYRRRKWTRRHEFKSWTRLIAFHIALIPLGKVWIHLFSLKLWVNSRTDSVLQPWWGN